jgi:hypothetical protein
MVGAAMVVFILKLVVLWTLIDVVVVATSGYLVATIRPAFPYWWRRVIAEEASFRDTLS